MRTDGARPLWRSVAVGAAILSFGLLAYAMQTGAITAFDDRIIALFRVAGEPTRLLGPAWVQEMGRDVTALGSLVFLGLVTAVALGYFALTEQMAAAGELMASGASGTAGAFGLKLLFDRPRPDIVHLARTFTSSFPSGHATLSVAVFLTLAAIVSRHQTRTAVRAYVFAMTSLLIAAVGLSRVYLGVHYPSDVLAGWALGLVCAIASATCVAAWRAAPRPSPTGSKG
ncbi:phosphatase PAP2 family protein [Bosea sp. 685]|uniref:phosphatase PAP2 family protein n=1 Tax=Bosea sp. 685 TaxID=3080057 RepID=UPI0028935227|nr:phosphatase PAP2 family protein [Bosea sp. 685]WNJ87977.1 phosphatase PAP2 family protein [Bosea sp. 685]